MLVVALLVSVLLEMLGMTFVWVDEGVGHSARMLDQELRYLSEDFRQSIVRVPPVTLARLVVDRTSGALQWLGLGYLMNWADTPSSDSQSAWPVVQSTVSRLRPYLEAAANVIKTFSVRVLVLSFSMPAFMLFGLVGFADGLTRRDLRRWGGGRESSFLYHHSKKLLAPSILTTWLLYLAMPVTVHPNLVVLPFAALFAAGIAITMATFKKYL